MAEVRDLLNIVMGVLLLLFGFMLNLMWAEITALRKADESMAKSIASLQTMMIDRSDFQNHASAEERALEKVWVAIDALRRLLHKVHVEMARIAGSHAPGDPDTES